MKIKKIVDMMVKNSKRILLEVTMADAQASAKKNETYLSQLGVLRRLQGIFKNLIQEKNIDQKHLNWIWAIILFYENRNWGRGQGGVYADINSAERQSLIKNMLARVNKIFEITESYFSYDKSNPEEVHETDGGSPQSRLEASASDQKGQLSSASVDFYTAIVNKYPTLRDSEEMEDISTAEYIPENLRGEWSREYYTASTNNFNQFIEAILYVLSGKGILLNLDELEIKPKTRQWVELIVSRYNQREVSSRQIAQTRGRAARATGDKTR